ncbi:hypothetical protein [Burkholderia multivorans]|uniref:hypothetical protein n=2 Tax=Burkholderia multivorans TaxID=87883 RepID=UPI0012DEC96A|nr:hypothetical protein [Burkholderia multivorans]MBU9341634.1 hypothetical protein [Burkholderia multivorans]WVN03881.1 hypothetical protein V1241_17220 [Burkholderia multivorans]
MMPTTQSSAAARKRKRAAPPDFGYQFAIGRPGRGIVDSAWRAVLGNTNGASIPPYEFHFEALWNIRNVVQLLEVFVHTYRGDVEPFVLHLDARGNSSIIAQSPARAIAELFTTDFVRLLRRIPSFFPDHRLHPLFEIFLDADPEHLRNNEIGHTTQIEVACNNYRSLYSKPTKFQQHGMIEAARILNKLSKTILEKARSVSEDIKQFRRAAQDTRTSAMQYAHHLITRAPNPFFAHLTIHRSPFAAGNGPVTYLEIRKIRERFKRTLNKEILETNYLGYSIFLRHNVKIGYWLDAFVYLSDSLGLALDTIYEMTQKWNSRVRVNGTEIIYMAWPAPPRE